MAKAPAKAGKKKSFKKKEKRVVHNGIVHIQATFNNTIVTIADPGRQHHLLVERRFAGLPRLPQGHSVRRAAGGHDGGQQGFRSGFRTVEVRVSGPGSGRESAVRALSTAGMDVRTIRDVTPIPHNGCRPPKKRRV
jgi:small subunit ribosomal protein S11